MSPHHLRQCHRLPEGRERASPLLRAHLTAGAAPRGAALRLGMDTGYIPKALRSKAFRAARNMPTLYPSSKRGCPAMKSVPFFGFFLAFAAILAGYRRIAMGVFALALVFTLVLFSCMPTDALNISL